MEQAELSFSNYYSSIANHYLVFCDEYSKIGESSSSLEAVSVLSQNRIELERNWLSLKRQLETQLQKSLREDYLENPLAIVEYTYFKIKAKSASDVGLDIDNDIFDESAFEALLSDYLKEDFQCKATQTRLSTLARQYFSQLYRLKGLELVLSNILLKDYPEELDTAISEQDIKEKISTSKPRLHLNSLYEEVYE